MEFEPGLWWTVVALLRVHNSTGCDADRRSIRYTGVSYAFGHRCLVRGYRL